MPAFKVTSSEEPNAPIVMESPALCWQQVGLTPTFRGNVIFLPGILVSTQPTLSASWFFAQVMQRVNQIRASKRPKTG